MYAWHSCSACWDPYSDPLHLLGAAAVPPSSSAVFLFLAAVTAKVRARGCQRATAGAPWLAALDKFSEPVAGTHCTQDSDRKGECGHTCCLGREPWRGWRWKSSKLLSPGPVPELAPLLGTQAANWEHAKRTFSLAPGSDVPAPPHCFPLLLPRTCALGEPVVFGRVHPSWAIPTCLSWRHAVKNFFLCSLLQSGAGFGVCSHSLRVPL